MEDVDISNLFSNLNGNTPLENKESSISMEKPAEVTENESQLSKEAIDLFNESQKAEYAKSLLTKEKKRLAYLKKHEKQIEEENVKKKLYQKKIETAEARYGYLYEEELYKSVNENGQLIIKKRYKNFTTNKFINKVKEISRAYKNFSELTRQLLSLVTKLFFIVTIVIIGLSLYRVIKLLIDTIF